MRGGAYIGGWEEDITSSDISMYTLLLTQIGESFSWLEGEYCIYETTVLSTVPLSRIAISLLIHKSFRVCEGRREEHRLLGRCDIWSLISHLTLTTFHNDHQWMFVYSHTKNLNEDKVGEGSSMGQIEYLHYVFVIVLPHHSSLLQEFISCFSIGLIVSWVGQIHDYRIPLLSSSSLLLSL